MNSYITKKAVEGGCCVSKSQIPMGKKKVLLLAGDVSTRWPGDERKTTRCFFFFFFDRPGDGWPVQKKLRNDLHESISQY